MGEKDEQDGEALTLEAVGPALSNLSKTADGLGFAFVKLELTNRGIHDISVLSSFTNLQHIDLTGNHIYELAPLRKAEYLLTLNVDGNAVTTLRHLVGLDHLQVVNLARNRIEHLEPVHLPALAALNLNQNILWEMAIPPESFPSLRRLELRGNKLTTTKGINVPSLRELYLALNEITEIEELDPMKQLEVLHLRGNRIVSLREFPETLGNLRYVNLRNNLIESLKEVEQLERLPNLTVLVLKGNPIAQTKSYRKEVLARLPNLTRLDKTLVSRAEREAAITVSQERKAVAEKLEAQGEQGPVS